MTLKDKLKYNRANKKATLATNFYNLETLFAVLNAAKNFDTSIILQVSESSVDYMGLNVIKGLVKAGLEQTGVEAWLHLDHGNNPDLVKKCIDIGFDSVMIDYSEKSISENIKVTSDIVKYAESTLTNVEAELGYVAKLGQSQEMVFTKPSEAKLFVESTGVDALAIAVGSAHGFYKETPQLQIDLIQEINEQVTAALVLHGSSGIPDNQIKLAINAGITKINLATEIKNAFMKQLKTVLVESSEIDLRKVFPIATDAAKDLVQDKLSVVLSA